MAKRLIKQTESLAVYKVWGTGSTDTISLATDLLSPTMVIDGTPKVSIGFAQWNISGAVGDKIKVTRNAVDVLSLQQNAGELDMSGNGGYLDNTEEASNIVVAITGTGDLYLTLRKTDGYKTKVEPELFGSYDNPTLVGS